jgi:hypothetical protein
VKRPGVRSLEILAISLALVSACSDDKSNDASSAVTGPATASGSGGAGATGGHGGSAATTSSDGGGDATGGGGGAPSCIGALEGACGECMELMCCSEISDCLANSACEACLMGNDLECGDATGSALLDAMFSCSQQLCKDTCFRLIDVYGCNPITNAGCDSGNDFVCDVDLVNGAFICTGPPHGQALCDACGPQDGFCNAGHSCVGSQCARFCCDDNDCGAGGVYCDKSYFAGVAMGEAGVCMDTQSVQQPACSGLPSMPPSGGSCIPFSG